MYRGTGHRRLTIAAVAVVLVVSGAVLHRVALAHVREVEAAFVTGRQVTACATAALVPFAEGGRDVEELPAALEEVIVDARADVAELSGKIDRADAPPYPRAGAATRAVREAIGAQLALYEAMVSEPGASDDELEDLGVANRRAEARLTAARSVLWVGAPPGWDDRNRCGRAAR